MQTTIWQSLFLKMKFKDERSHSVMRFCSQNARGHLRGSETPVCAWVPLRQ